MRSTTSLAIPQPCTESWDAISPTAQDRHCAACAKTVVDFTLKTDAEILAYLAGAVAGRTCGRFAAGQLGRPLQRAASAVPGGRWRAWLTAAVAVWAVREGVSMAAQAQAAVEINNQMDKPAVMPANLRAARKPEFEGLSSQAVILRGVAQEYETGAGLPGVTVVISNSQVGASTDGEGAFEMVVPAGYAAVGFVELEVFSVGFISQRRRVLLVEASDPLQFRMEEDVKGGLEITIAPPAPWHPRAFYYWGKYWLTRPFHRS